jgi:enoyl-CoA hydratase/carnithine racemase
MDCANRDLVHGSRVKKSTSRAGKPHFSAAGLSLAPPFPIRTPMPDHLKLSTAAGVLHIRFDRPEKKNAFTAPMYAGIAAALEQARDDAAVRVVLLSGEGGAFTAGNDLQDFMHNPPDLEPGPEPGPVVRFMRALAATPKVVVAAVQGPAVGVGATLLLHCDLVLAADNARLSLPFINLGLVPEFGSTLLLPQRIGYLQAAELALLGEAFDAATALRLGLVNRVLPAAELDQAALALAGKLAAKAPEALLLTRRLLKSGGGAGGEALMQRIDEESGHFARRLRSAEFREAATAFFEKRPPDFSGLS